MNHYLVGQNNVGQNYLSDKIFLTYQKFRNFCPTKNFVYFQNFRSNKTQFIYVFRYLLFLYHKNKNKKRTTTTQKNKQKNKQTNKTKQNKKTHILLFKIYAELDLTVLIQRLSFYFWPNHFTIDFLYILIIRIVNLRWFSLLFWFHPSLSSSPSIMISVAS